MIGTKQYKAQLEITLTTETGDVFKRPIELVVGADSKEAAETMLAKSNVTAEITHIALTAIHHVGRDTGRSA